MSFAHHTTICRPDISLTMVPTAQERQLSQLVRPGMYGGRQIKQILPAGKYAYDPAGNLQWKAVSRSEPDVAERRRYRVRRPKLIRIENIDWHRCGELSWTADLPRGLTSIFAPVDIADDAGLGYYNCRLVTAGDVISLNHRGFVTDFNYHDDYFDRYVMGVVGSSLIEQHEFAHVDTPHCRRSGYLVIGKMDDVGQALELTAFAVRPGDNVYIPARTIHTNDYLLGRWQTLLSSACEIPNARIRKPDDEPIRFVGERHR